MATINRRVETEYERRQLMRFIENRATPFTITLTDGKARSSEQNRLQMQWVKEIAEQRGDMAPEDVRAECKLQFGVPILRHESEAFREAYDRLIKPMPYPTKLALMREPFDFAVTRLMTTKQIAAYLDAIHAHFTALGIILTDPEEMRLGARRVA